MNHLTAELIKCENQLEGILAHEVLNEGTRASYEVQCLCRTGGGTEISAIDGVLDHLVEIYGRQVVWALARQVALRGM